MATTATVTRVSSEASSKTLLAANPNRLQAIFMNDSSAVLYVKLGTGPASSSDFSYKLAAGETLELPQMIFPYNEISGRKEGCYDGIVTGIWASANGGVQVTELS